MKNTGKKVLSLFLSLAMIFSFATVPALSAYAYSIGDLVLGEITYTYLENGNPTTDISPDYAIDAVKIPSSFTYNGANRVYDWEISSASGTAEIGSVSDNKAIVIVSPLVKDITVNVKTIDKDDPYVSSIEYAPVSPIVLSQDRAVSLPNSEEYYIVPPTFSVGDKIIATLTNDETEEFVYNGDISKAAYVFKSTASDMMLSMKISENVESFSYPLANDTAYYTIYNAYDSSVSTNVYVCFEGIDDDHEHDFQYSSTVPPTCTKGGYDIFVCSCGQSEQRNPTEPTGIHNFDEGRVTPPTCTEQGYTTYTCRDCGVTSTDNYVNAAGHKWGEGTVTKAATESEEGTLTYYCTVCGAVLKTEAIAKLPSAPAADNTPAAESTTASDNSSASAPAAANPVKVTAVKKTARVKASALKKKDQTIALKKVVKVSKAKGTLTYEKKSGNKSIKINKKTGKITLKKGLKKGTYKIKMKVKDSGNSSYKAATKTVTFKITVR